MVVEALGHEPFDGLADQLVAAVAEHALDLAVHQHDHAELVDSDDGVRGELEQLLELALGRAGALGRGVARVTHGWCSLPLVITQLSPARAESKHRPDLVSNAANGRSRRREPRQPTGGSGVPRVSRLSRSDSIAAASKRK